MNKARKLLDIIESAPTVLIVEDSLEFMEVLYHKFQEMGWNTIRATNVDQAKQAIDQSKDIIDLVVTDFHLGSERGNEVAEYAKEHMPDTPVILQSGDPDDPDVNKELFDKIYNKVNLKDLFQDIGA